MRQSDADDVGIPFLAADPPHWAARGLAYILILLFTATAVASAVVKIPETVSSTFVLVPVRGADPIRSMRNGVVRDVSVLEGARVRKGEALFVLQSEPVAGFTADLRVIETELKGASESLANARARYEREKLADAERLRQLQSRLSALARAIQFKQRQLELTRDVASRFKQTLEEGLISQVELSRAELEVERMVLELDQARAERDETQSSIDALGHEIVSRQVAFQELERSLNETVERGRIRKRPVQDALTNSKGNLLTVVSPCDGTVTKLDVKAAGAIVREGDTLSEIACADERLQAALSVPQSGMALIRRGQGVKLLFDAFPYQRYGFRRGVVRWISPAADSEQNGTFRVLADIEADVVFVKGEGRPLMAGMGGRADVVVGRRSLISFAIEPVRQLRENMADVGR